MLVQLPNGFVEGQDHFNHVEIEELKGKQQNYLANRELVVGNLGHIPKILEDLIVSIQTREGIKWLGKNSEAINRLPVGDLETLLVKIREKTYGSRFYHEADCSNCGHKNKNLRLNLDQLKITELPLKDLITPKLVILPKSKLEVELKPLYLKDIFEVIKINNKKQDSLVTSVIALSIKRIGDKLHNIEKELENMSATDLSFIQEKMDEIVLQGSIDTDIEVACESCNKDFTIKLNCYDVSFLALTRGSTNSNI